MKQVFAFLADGFEEVECLTVVDLLRRGGVPVKTVSIMGRLNVAGGHGITVQADALIEEVSMEEAGMLFLPGGGLGTENLSAHFGLGEAVKKAAGGGKRLGGICAAPRVLGKYGLLDGKRATCYPGFEGKLGDACYATDGVVTDGMITTARGMGYAVDLGLELLAILTGIQNSRQIRSEIQFEY